MSGLVVGDDARVLEALGEAGWTPGRRHEGAERWNTRLEAAGFVVHDLARQVWGELGGLTIESSVDRDPPCSLFVDPVDAGIDSLDEVRLLNEKCGESFAPLGMWAVQFRSYIGTGGRVVAVTVRTLWELGSTFAEALDYTVIGDGTDRARTVDWL